MAEQQHELGDGFMLVTQDDGSVSIIGRAAGAFGVARLEVPREVANKLAGALVAHNVAVAIQGVAKALEQMAEAARRGVSEP